MIGSSSLACDTVPSDADVSAAVSEAEAVSVDSAADAASDDAVSVTADPHPTMVSTIAADRMHDSNFLLPIFHTLHLFFSAKRIELVSFIV